MADIKRFVIIDDNGQIVEQTDNMTIEVDAGTTARSVVNKGQLDQVASDAAAAVANEASARSTADTLLGDSISALQGMLDSFSAGTTGDLAAVNLRVTNEIAERILDVQEEEARALAAEAALQTAINTEISDRQAAVTAEAADRTAADAALGVRIDGETAARATLDTTLRGLITAEETARAAADTVLTNALGQEITDRAAADTALQTNIDTEQAARIAADNTLQVNIDAEAALRVSGDSALTAALNAETLSRQTADNALRAEIDAEESARATEIARVDGRIDTETAARAAAVLAEATARADADATLTASLAAEVARATARENEVEAKYDAGIAAEIVARSAADADNAAAISAETARAVLAESTLTANLTAEINRAADRENAIEDALEAEVTRATAEEIAVEGRAKAYTDARVQGLRVKDAVDYAVTRFVPAWEPDVTDRFKPVYRTVEEALTLNGVTYPRFTPIKDIPEMAALVALNEYTAFQHQLLSADYRVARFFGRVVDGALTLIDTQTWVTFEYIYNGETKIFDNNIANAYGESAVTSEGNAIWAAAAAQGYRRIPLAFDVVDLADEATRIAWYSHYRGVHALPEEATARIAVVQNTIGNDPSSSEAPRSGVWADFAYLNIAAINALPVAEREGAMYPYFDTGYLGSTAFGIYQRAVDDADVVTFPRAPDFAAGLDVNGAYCLTEQGVFGPIHDEGFDGFYWNYFSSLDHGRLTAQNIGLVFSNTNSLKTIAFVGTDAIKAQVFNRIGAYTFGWGLKRNPMAPTQIEVKGSRNHSVGVDSEGVHVVLGSVYDTDGTNMPAGYHIAHIPENHDYAARKGLGLVGPLVEGRLNSADALHAHNLITVPYRLYKTDSAQSWGEFNDACYNLFNGMKAVRPVSDADLAADPIAHAIQLATWDFPDFCGVSCDMSARAIPSTEGQKKWTGEVYDREYQTQHIAVAGAVQLPINTTSSNVTVNDILYVGGTPGTFVKFADVPSGKWAIPALKCLGIVNGNSNAYKVLDRPAFLKA